MFSTFNTDYTIVNTLFVAVPLSFLFALLVVCTPEADISEGSPAPLRDRRESRRWRLRCTGVRAGPPRRPVRSYARGCEQNQRLRELRVRRASRLCGPCGGRDVVL